MATKSIVPRGSGEGGLGRDDKHWGALYVNSCPLMTNALTAHNNNTAAHPAGIAGNAATASKFRNAVNINGVSFDGSENIDVDFTTSHETFSYADMEEIFNEA